MASSPPRSPAAAAAAASLLLLALLQATTASAQIIKVTVKNNAHAELPLNTTNYYPVPGFPSSIVVNPGEEGVMALNATDPFPILVFYIGPNTYYLVSNMVMNWAWKNKDAPTHGVLLTVSGPPCIESGHRNALLTVAKVVEYYGVKCALKKRH